MEREKENYCKYSNFRRCSQAGSAAKAHVFHHPVFTHHPAADDRAEPDETRSGRPHSANRKPGTENRGPIPALRGTGSLLPERHPGGGLPHAAEHPPTLSRPVSQTPTPGPKALPRPFSQTLTPEPTAEPLPMHGSPSPEARLILVTAAVFADPITEGPLRPCALSLTADPISDALPIRRLRYPSCRTRYRNSVTKLVAKSCCRPSYRSRLSESRSAFSAAFAALRSAFSFIFSGLRPKSEKCTYLPGYSLTSARRAARLPLAVVSES